MENKNLNFTILLLVCLVFIIMVVSSCSDDFLDHSPSGVISSSDLQNVEGAEMLVTAAYASLGNDHYNNAAHTSNWLYGGVRSEDSYKGGGGASNRFNWHKFEIFTGILTIERELNDVWTAFYQAIDRANKALNMINSFDEMDYPQKIQRQAEMRFLRAHNYFRLVMFFKNVPWIDETIPVEEYKSISNREFTQDQLWDKIAEDFQFAMDNLPDVQSQVGRASAVAAAAYLARTRLFQAYEQDESHNVVTINPARLQQVVNLTDYVIDSGKHDLFDDYAKNYLTEFDNGSESVFAIQHSRNDGTPEGRMDWAHGLNYNMSPRYGCCWFNVPSHNLVNAFRTNDNGLPLFDLFNTHDPLDFEITSFDPRISHTVGIPGHPFKYDPNFIYEIGWARVPEVYGPHSTMKEIQHPDSPDFRPVASYFVSAKNIDIVRYSDVLLMKAEALIELGQQAEALPLINMLRARAANSTGRVRFADGSAPLDYNIEPYQDGMNIDWTQANAREAMRWERRLEFSMESWRFFDLVRWGIAAEKLNDYFEVERTRLEFLNDAFFTKNRNEYLPIPNAQIERSEGLYQQNPGY